MIYLEILNEEVREYRILKDSSYDFYRKMKAFSKGRQSETSFRKSINGEIWDQGFAERTKGLETIIIFEPDFETTDWLYTKIEGMVKKFGRIHKLKQLGI